MKKIFKWTLIILLSMAAIGAIFGEDEEETNTEELKAENKEIEKVTSEQVDLKENEEAKKKAAEKEEKEKEAAEKKAAEEQAQKDQKEQEEKERKEKEEAEKAAEAKKEESQKELENEFLTILEESMQGVARVEFDRENKTYRLYPTDPGMKTVVAGLTQGQYLQEWAVMTEQFRTLSDSASQLLGTGYALQMANPANEENILIIIMDGKVIYNAVDEI